MTGGQATAAGMNFQRDAGAWLSTYILAARSPAILGIKQDVGLTSILFETSNPVDDILCETTNHGFCFFNVKTTVRNESNPDSAFGKVIDQFVRQYHAGVFDPRTKKTRKLDSGIDRLVLIVDRTKANNFYKVLNELVNRIAETNSLNEESFSAEQKSHWGNLRKHISDTWLRHVDRNPNDTELIELISLIKIIALDFKASEQDNAKDLLKNSVLSDPQKSDLAWSILCQAASEFAENRSGADRGTLLSKLRNSGVAFNAVQNFRADIEKLLIRTSNTLGQLQKFSLIRVPEDGEKFEIQRSATEAIANHARRQSFLVIGEPGAGKSGALVSAAGKVINEGHPVLMLDVDSYPVASLDELQIQLGLSNPIDKILEQWQGDKPGILFIDALDASRGGRSGQVFRDLIESVSKIPGWNIVASIRKFDLQNGVIYQDLFSGSNIDANFCDSAFTHIQHFLIPVLNETELDQIWQRSPKMSQIYESAGSELRQLLRSPFNLYLLSNILATGTVEPSAIATQLKLLENFWLRRLTADSPNLRLTRERLLIDVVSAMINTHQLSVNLSTLGTESTKYLPELLSVGLLQQEGNIIKFFHHMLFDFAAAKLVLDSGRSPDFSVKLTATGDQTLLLAPSALLAFQMLWESDNSRSLFWKTAVELASNTAVGSFCRMLPARTAAFLVRKSEDLDYLINIFQNSEGENAAWFLVQHLYGTYLASPYLKISSGKHSDDTWLSASLKLAKKDTKESCWPWVALIARFSDNDSVMQAPADLNQLSCLILERGIKFNFPNAIIWGVRGVCKTFTMSPQKSSQAIRELLTPSLITKQGYRDLYWLAREVKGLINHSPALVGNIYQSIFESEMPSRDDETDFGNNSKILPLRSNKRQDFEMVRRELTERFPDFLKTSPSVAMETLLILIGHWTRTERKVDIVAPVTFSYLGSTTSYIPDESYYWLESRNEDSASYEGEVIGLLHQLYHTLVGLSDSTKLRELFAAIGPANGWAAVWNMIFHAASKHPQTLMEFVIPALSIPEVYTGSGYFAIEALQAIHSVATPTSKSSIENAISLMSDEKMRVRCLSALSANDIANPDLKRLRLDLEEKGEVRNTPRRIASARWIREDEDEWLEKVVEKSGHQLDSDSIKLFKDFKKWANELPNGDIQRREYFTSGWTRLKHFFDNLLDEIALPEKLRDEGWGILQSALRRLLETCENRDHLSLYGGIEEMILAAFDHCPLAYSEKELIEEEIRFADSAAWGSHPKIDATSSLMLYCRAAGEAPMNFQSQIKSLAVDPVPAVRLQVFSHVNVICKSAPEFMWQLCDLCFSKETNPSIVGSFLNSCQNIIGMRPDYFVGPLLKVESNYPTNAKDEKYEQILVSLISRLALIWKSDDARSRVDSWLEKPMENASRIIDLLQLMRSTISQGDIDKDDHEDNRIRHEGIRIYQTVVNSALPFFDLNSQENAKKALQIVDTAMMQIMFSSGSHEARRRSGDKLELYDAKAPRFLRELYPVLELIARFPYPSVTHHLLETLEYLIPVDPVAVFRLLISSLKEGGTHGGYQTESLGADLFIKIIRRYLADYKEVFSIQGHKQDLLIVLDEFVKTGWTHARQLAYELPEILR